MPDSNDLYQAFNDAALHVRTPGSSSDHDYDNVKQLVERFEICYVLAADEATKNELLQRMTTLIVDVAYAVPKSKPEVEYKMEAVERLCEALQETNGRLEKNEVTKTLLRQIAEAAFALALQCKPGQAYDADSTEALSRDAARQLLDIYKILSAPPPELTGSSKPGWQDFLI